MIRRVIKAGQIKQVDEPINIDHGQVIPKPPEPDIDPNEDAFAAEAFKMLSSEELATGGKITTKPQPATVSVPAANDTATGTNATSSTVDDDDSHLSQAARKSRYASVLEKLKIKELELEAMNDELKEWEARLQQAERELVEKEQQITQENIKKRQDVEAECNQTMKMAKEAAEAIKAAAKTEADAIKKAAKIEVDSVRDKAYKEGYDSGEAKGIADGEAQGYQEIQVDWKNMMNETDMLIKELQASRMGILKSGEEEMLKLVIAFAKSIIKVEPIVQPDVVLQNIDMALNNIAQEDKIVMRVNMRDKAMCEAHKEQFLSRLGTISELQIVEDPGLSPGGIKIETGIGTIDATIETQARALEKALLDKFQKAQAGLQ